MIKKTIISIVSCSILVTSLFADVQPCEDANNVRINKVLLKLIEAKERHSACNIESKHGGKPTCACKSHKIKESFIKYDPNKEFTVIKKTGIYNLPSLKASTTNVIEAGTKFTADMYTKAGWVHDMKSSGWIKGAKINPELKNNTSHEDNEKWNKQINQCKGRIK